MTFYYFYVVAALALAAPIVFGRRFAAAPVEARTAPMTVAPSRS
jgi:hypothetical protein